MSPGLALSLAEQLLLYILLPTPLRANRDDEDQGDVAGIPVRDLEIAAR
jgi:hypothetical protein